MNPVPPKTEPAQNEYRQYGVPDETGGYHLIPTGITVQADQIKVDPEIGHHDAGKGDDADKIEGPTAPKSRDQAHMEYKGIDHDGNQGPCFLGIPAPITAPALISPLPPQEVPDREHHQTHGKGEFIDDGEFLDAQVHPFLVL